MRVGNAIKNDYLQNTYQTIAPLNMVLKVFGLGCYMTDKKSSTRYIYVIKHVLRAAILAIIDCYTLNYKIQDVYPDVSASIKYTDAAQMLYDFSQYVVDIFYVHKYGTGISFEYFKQYAVIDQILGVINYSLIKKQLLKLMGIFALLWTLTSVCDFVAWGLTYNWMVSGVYSISYLFLLVKILTTLDLTSQVMHIEARLRAVGDLVQSYSSSTENASVLLEENATNKKWLDYDTRHTVAESLAKLDSLKRLPCINHHEIKWLSRCYLLLTEQAAFVNKMYGLRILLNSLSLLIDMVRFTNIAARLISGTQSTWHYSGYYPAMANILRMFICAGVLISLVWHCEQVYGQTDRIKRIIDNTIVFKHPSDELKSGMSELHNLIQARPIDLNMANFFRLDNYLLVSTASVVVTYTIILLQSIN